MKNFLWVFFLILSLSIIGCDKPSENKQNIQKPTAELIANPGLAKKSSINSVVLLNGSGSNNIDEKPLNFKWSFASKPIDSKSTLTDSGTQNPSFVPDKSGEYIVNLVVTADGHVSEPQTVIVTAYEPIAIIAGEDRVTTGIEMVLDGTKSEYGGNEELHFDWALTKLPDNSVSALTDTSTANPIFIPDVDGIYEISLRVNNGIVQSKIQTITILSTTKPIASAGQDMTVSVGLVVELDGTKSSSSNNFGITYQWKLLDRPLNSFASLSDSTSVTPTFVPDKAGDYIINLIINDSIQDSIEDKVSIAAQLPIADAGSNLQVSTQSKVTLDGSKSDDASNLHLTLNWELVELPEGSTAALSDSSAIKPDFVPDVDGDYVFRLTVNNGVVDSEESIIVITASSPNANAGKDIKTNTGNAVTLDGSQSTDGAGLGLTYKWTMINKPVESKATLVEPTTIKPSFIADINGDYEIELVVNNGYLDSATDTVVVNSTTAPVADAGEDRLVSVNQEIELDGSRSSNINDAELIYRWDIISAPENSNIALSSNSIINPTFTPDTEGEYKFGLVVNNLVEDSQKDTLSITTKLPIADPGPAYNVTPETTVTLNGNNSIDFDDTKSKLTYLWSLTKPDISSTSLSDVTLASPNISIDEVGKYEACLIVNNSFVESEKKCVELNGRLSVGNSSGIYSTDFEDVTLNNNWSITNGVWQIGKPESGPNVSYVGNGVAATTLGGKFPDGTSSLLVSPQVSLPILASGEIVSFKFQHWFDFSSCTTFCLGLNYGSATDYGRVQISTQNADESWSDWIDLASHSKGSSGGWSAANLDLTSHSGKNVKIGFYLENQIFTGGFCSGCTTVSDGWYIDEVIIDKSN